MGRPRDVVVIGASAGGVAVLRELLSKLKPSFRASVFIVLHRAPQGKSRLVEVLGRSSPLPVREPRDGDPIVHGVVYVAPPDHHMRVVAGLISLDRHARVHHLRPAVDPLFVSAAEAYGARTVGVLLTGNLSDGVAGLVAIKKRGGLSVVQDPAEAEWPSMPTSALLHDHVDIVSKAAALPTVLRRLLGGESTADAVRRLGGEAMETRRRKLREALLEAPR